MVSMPYYFLLFIMSIPIPSRVYIVDKRKYLSY